MYKRITMLVMAGAMLTAWLCLTGCSRPAQEAAPPQPMAGMPDATPPPAPGATIRQVGSTTVLPLAEKWRDEFNKLHPDVSLAVSGGGSGAGIAALLDGTAEVADASREIKDKEKQTAATAGITPVEHVVAYDGIAVIVHPDNPLSEISEEKLADIYTGKITKWDAVGAKGLGDIQVVNRDSSSGTYEAFKEMVVQLHGKAKENDFAAGTLNQSSNAAVKSLVAQTKAAIGYVGLGYVDDTVKVLGIIPMGSGAAVKPSIETVQDKTYPISRPLFMYTNGEPTGALQQYFEYVKGDAGQAIVKDLGFVPISKPAA